MRKLKLVLITALLSVTMFSLFSTPVQAVVGQWSNSGNTVYYSDGKVGVGLSSPTALFEVGTLSAGRTTGMFSVDEANNKIYFGRVSSTGGDNLGNVIIRNRNNSTLFDFDLNQGVSKFYSSVSVGGGAGELSIYGRTDQAIPVIHFRESDTGDDWAIRDNGDDLILGEEVSSKERVTFKKGGNVGIGTTNPTELLSVNGTILAKEMIVSSSSVNWPDYVFDKNYKLMSLRSLQKYINENKHLPGIASAEEISKSGVLVADMQQKQMQKIEELTLYILNLQSQINDLKQNINSKS